MALLGSEKTILSAQHYFDGSFVGVIQGEFFFRPDMEVLNRAYRELITKKTSLNVLFSGQQSKRIRLIPFIGVREFKNKREVAAWKRQPLDMDFGPYQEVGVLPSPWPWIKRTKTYFKAHHLIFDGLSFVYVWDDFCKLYKEILTQETSSSVVSDGRAYQAVMDKFLALEKQNYSAKKDFWVNYLKGHDCGRPIQGDLSGETTESFSLSTKCVQKFHSAKKKYGVDGFSALTGVYSKALQNILGITSLCLRVPNSFRHHLQSPEERYLMANLARSFPLLVDCTEERAGVIAQKNKVKMKELVAHLPLNPLPWGLASWEHFQRLRESLCIFPCPAFLFVYIPLTIRYRIFAGRDYPWWIWSSWCFCQKSVSAWFLPTKKAYLNRKKSERLPAPYSGRS